MDTVLRIVKTPIFWIVTVVLILLTGVGVAGFYQYKKVQSELSVLKDNPSGGQLTDERQRELITEVSAKIMLPQDEKPTVAVVSDINRLKDQQFFSAGQNGDVVLIYMSSKKAILYRPADKKIVELAPVNLTDNNQATVAGSQAVNPPTTPATTVSPTPAAITGTFALRNGTTVTGLARTFEGQLTQAFPSVSVNERGNAVKRDYSSTIIVDVKGTKSAEVTQIAQRLGIQTGTLPAGEVTTTADFLVIIGSDRQ
jgi:hypothetical protein